MAAYKARLQTGKHLKQKVSSHLQVCIPGVLKHDPKHSLDFRFSSRDPYGEVFVVLVMRVKSAQTQSFLYNFELGYLLTSIRKILNYPTFCFGEGHVTFF